MSRHRTTTATLISDQFPHSPAERIYMARPGQGGWWVGDSYTEKYYAEI